MKSFQKLSINGLLLYAGLALLCVNNVEAQVNNIDLSDELCTPTEQELNFCVQDSGYYIGVAPENNVWPKLNSDGTTSFRYKVAIADGGNCEQTWNYSIWQLAAISGTSPLAYIVDSDPNGASIEIDKDSKCELPLDDPPRVNFKLNVTANCKGQSKPKYFEITTSTPNIDCGVPTTIRFNDTCSPPLPTGRLRGPGPSNSTTLIQQINFTDGQVVFDQCFGVPIQVTLGGEIVEPNVVKLFACGPDALNGDYSGCVSMTEGGPNGEGTGPKGIGCFIEANPKYYAIGGDGYKR